MDFTRCSTCISALGFWKEAFEERAFGKDFSQTFSN
jgi:hypothetical protein